MMELHTGDPCPCCGKPIKQTDPEVLRLLGLLAEMMGLGKEATELDSLGARDE